MQIQDEVTLYLDDYYFTGYNTFSYSVYRHGDHRGSEDYPACKEYLGDYVPELKGNDGYIIINTYSDDYFESLFDSLRLLDDITDLFGHNRFRVFSVSNFPNTIALQLPEEWKTHSMGRFLGLIICAGRWYEKGMTPTEWVERSYLVKDEYQKNHLETCAEWLIHWFNEKNMNELWESNSANFVHWCKINPYKDKDKAPETREFRQEITNPFATVSTQMREFTGNINDFTTTIEGVNNIWADLPTHPTEELFANLAEPIDRPAGFVGADGEERIVFRDGDVDYDAAIATIIRNDGNIDLDIRRMLTLHMTAIQRIILDRRIRERNTIRGNGRNPFRRWVGDTETNS